MITLKNANLLINVLPERGARIDDLVDRNTGKNWLWHPEDYKPGSADAVPIGSSFDDHWQGGWEDVFPNDAATDLDGRRLFDHGELWSPSWQVDHEESKFDVTLSRACASVPVQVTKQIRLDEEKPEVEVTYRFYNDSWNDVVFMFKQHPALVIEAGDEILMPACRIQAVEPDFSTICACREWSDFPLVTDKKNQRTPIHLIPPYDGVGKEFVYATDFGEGRCGLKNKATGTSLIFEFDTVDFPYVWLFQSHGGFRDHYVAMIEPATTMPWDIHEARRRGTAVILKPHVARTYRIKAKIGAFSNAP